MPSDDRHHSQPDGRPRIKGIALLEVVKGLRLHRQAALAKLPENLRAYLERRVEIGEWYPEADHLGLLRAAAELFGPPGLEAWRWMGRQRAILDLQEIFSEHLHNGDPAATLAGFEQLWRLYRDSGRVETVMGSEPPYRIRLVDYPFLSSETVRLFTGYIEAAFELGGLEGLRAVEPAEWTPECAEWIIERP